MLAQNMYIHHLAALFVIYTQVHHHNQNSEQEIQKAIRSLLEEYIQAQSGNRLPAWENESASTKLPTLLQQFAKSYQLSQIGVALHKYLLALQTAGRLPATIKNYRSDIGQYLSFVSSNSPDQIVQKTEVAHFIEYEQTRGSSNSTIQRKLASMGQFFQWLQENGWLTTNQWKSFSAQEFTELLKGTKSVRELTTPVSQVDKRPAVWSLPLKNIDVQQYLPKHFTNSPIKKIKKAPFFSRIKQAMGAQPLLGYFNLAMGVLFLIGTTFLGYQQFFSGANSSQAFPANLTRPNRSLSFQGRLTSATRTPITAVTPMRFRLYDSGPATGSGNLLWDSTSCNIDPDQDGIFSTTLGDACGTEIASDVFTENSNVWLEVQVNSEILNPRQSIKTVAYALNSETLQGYPASASAVESTVLVMRSDGKVVFGNANPILEATGDSFAITAKTLTLETSSGSNGNVIINPDGTGQTLINSNTLIEGYLSAPGATLSATYAGGRALTLKAGPSATGDIMQWQTSVGTPLGVIDKSGNIGIGTTVARAALEIAGSASSSGTLTFKGTTDPKIDILNGENFGLRTSVGGDVGLTERLTVLNSGNVGIGTTAPGAKLAIANTGTANGIILGSDQGTPVNIYHSNSPVDGVLYLSGSRIQLNGQYTTINSTYTSLGSYISNSPIVLGGQNLGFNNDNNNDRMRIKGGVGSENALRFLLSDASTEVFRINSTGTASSSGVLTFRGTTDPKINVLNGENFGIQTSVGGDVGLTEKFTILSNGNVGIGSATPSQKLEVGGDAEIANYLYFANGATNYLRFDGSDFILSNNFLPSANNTYNLGASGTRWANIYGTNLYQNGNQVCDTSGNCSSVGNLWQYANGGISPATPYTSVADFYIGGNATASAKFAILNVNSGTPTASVSAGTAGAANLTATGILGTTNRQTLTLGSATTGNVIIAPAGSTAMTVLQNGNVGIGTTNPTEILHLIGNSSSPGGVEIRLKNSNSGGDTRMTLANSDDKSILVQATGSSYALPNTASFATEGGLSMGFITDGHLSSGGTSDMIFKTGGYSAGQERVRILSTGNVGIGSTAPGTKLDVTGTGRFSTGIDANGTSSTITNLVLDGNTGTALNISGTSFTTDFSLQNSETIDNDTDNTIKLSFGAANGILNLTSATEAFLTSSVALNIDSATTNALNIGTGANAKTITLGNATGTTALNLNSGTGDITLTSTDIISLKPTSGVNYFNYASADNRAQFYNSGGTAYLAVGYWGSPRIESLTSNLHINYNADSHVYLFGGAASGDNRNLYVYGYDTGATAQKYGLFNVDTSGDFNIEAVSGEAIQLKTGGADVLTIASNGNVGIGSTVPTAVFQTVGSGAKTGSFTAARIDNTATTTTNAIDKFGLYINSTGTWDGSSDNSNNYGLYINVADGSPSRDWGIYTVGADKNYLSGTLEVGGFSTQYTNGLCWDGSGNSIIYDCNGTPGDYAEYYGSSDWSVSAGDIVIVDPSRSAERVIDNVGAEGSKAWVIKSSNPYQNSIVGVVSTYPNQTIGENFNPSENPQPIAISGRVPVKVSTMNGNIYPGDLITSSSIPGVGMKATGKGQIVARALDSYTNSDPNQIGTIIAQLNVSWYDGSEPDYISVEEIVNLQIAGSNEASYQVTNAVTATPINDRFAAFTRTITAIIEAGLTRTKELVVTGRAQIADLSVANLSINGQTLREYVVSIIQENQATNPVIVEVSPTPAPVATASESAWLAEVFQRESTTGEPIVEDLTVTDLLTTQDIDATSVTTESLNVNGQTQLGSLLVSQNASVAGVMTVNELDANSARIDALEAGMAQLDSVRATTAEFANATVSGTLYAQTIADLDKQIAELLNQPSMIDVITGNIPSPQDDFTSLYQVLGSISSTASQAAQLDQSVADLNLASDDIVLDANAGFIDRYFKVNGVAYIGDSLGVGNTLRVGSKLEMTDTYLSFSAGASTPDEAPVFFIQPSGKGMLALMGDLMILDEVGQVTINGNLHVAGNVSVEGSLLANVIEPLNPGESIKLSLGSAGTSLEATMAGQIASPSGQFEVLGDAGTPVATVSAQGKASFSSLSLGRDLLERPNVAGAATESSQLTQEATQTTGRAILPAGNKELIIRNPYVRRDSLIYLTPLGSTNNQVLFVKTINAPADESIAQATDERSFTVSLDNTTATDISFTWWIVN